jgi:hypothetical protein
MTAYPFDAPPNVPAATVLEDREFKKRFLAPNSEQARNGGSKAIYSVGAFPA